MTGRAYRARTETIADDTLLVVRGGLLEYRSLRSDAIAANEPT